MINKTFKLGIIGLLMLILISGFTIATEEPVFGISLRTGTNTEPFEDIKGGNVITYGSFTTTNENTYFNGIDNAITTPILNEDLQNGFTIAGTFKLNNLNTQQVIFSSDEYPRTSETGGVSCKFSTSGYGHTNTMLCSINVEGGAQETIQSSQNSIQANTEYEYIYTWNNAVGKMYINKVENVAYRHTSASGTLIDNNKKFDFGRFYQDSSYGLYLNGYLNNSLIWDRALTSTEITNLDTNS